MNYKKIAGSRRGLGQWHTLWLRDDHLLAVQSTGYSEEYARYYLKDIQAIVSRRTVAGKVWNAALGLLLVLSVIAALSTEDPGLKVLAGILGGTFLLFLLWNLFRGPTCRCHVVTPLGVEELPPLDRIKSVKKALDRLCPLVVVLQGEIGRDEMAQLARAAKDAPPAAKVAGSSVAGPQNAASSYRGGWHLAAFLLLLAEAAVSSLQMLHNSKALLALSACLCLTFAILAVMALIKQRDHLVAPLARWMTWGGMATMVAGSTVGYFFMVFLTIEQLGGKGVAITQSEMLEHYGAIQPAQHPSFAAFIVTYAIVSAAIAIIGVIAIGIGRGRAARSLP